MKTEATTDVFKKKKSEQNYPPLNFKLLMLYRNESHEYVNLIFMYIY